MEELTSSLLDANTQWVLLGTLLLGISSGILGSFVLLKKQSLIGDAMAHAALPGVCIAFLITGEKFLPYFLIGATITGLLATYCIQGIVKYSRIKADTAIGLVLTVFFGFGIVLLTIVTQSGSGNKSGLDSFIFGQAASMVSQDVKIMVGVSLVLIIIITALFKELKLLTFDPAFAQGLGMPAGMLNLLLMTLVTGAVVTGIQAVGVVLMAAMLITPAAAARYWTERLDRMVIIAGLFGALSGMFGTILSTGAKGLPTGPLIVLAATAVFVISLLFSPKRGLIMKAWRAYRLRSIVAREHVLSAMYNLLEERQHPILKKEQFSTGEIENKKNMHPLLLASTLKKLQQDKLIVSSGQESWRLTNQGLKEAYSIVYQNRLTEIYLMNETKFTIYGIHSQEKDAFAHWPEYARKELAELLHDYGREPLVHPFGLHQQGDIMKEGAGG